MTAETAGELNIAYGLNGVVVDDTRICLVNGTEGKLWYYGYDILDLAEKCSYEEVVHLLLKGRLPDAKQLEEIDKELKNARGLPDKVLETIEHAPETSIPMDVLRTCASQVALTDPNPGDSSNESRYSKALRLIALMPEIVAADYRKRRGQSPITADPELGHAANFLYMLHGEKPRPDAAKTMDVALVLHAEHGFNASTFTARVVAATLSDMYSAVTAAIGALKGPLHGGANEGVIKLLLDIREPGNIESYLDEKLSQKGFRVMGFGHRVYKVLDPRAIVLKRYSERTGKEAGNTKWFEMSDAIEKFMLTREKPLYPNVDFYSASTYYTMGLPPEIFTPIFAVSRVSGWCAHVIEQQNHNKLIRPKAHYAGEIGLEFKPIDQR